jgi:hypothetical protein
MWFDIERIKKLQFTDQAMAGAFKSHSALGARGVVFFAIFMPADADFFILNAF